jgi:hypothetical protein
MLGERIVSSAGMVRFINELIHGDWCLSEGKELKEPLGGLSAYVGTKQLTT